MKVDNVETKKTSLCLDNKVQAIEVALKIKNIMKMNLLL